MTGLKRAICALVALASLGTCPSSDAADLLSFHPDDLEVYGGEETWHTDNSFHLSWGNPPSPRVAAVHYRVRDAEGAVVVGDTRIAGEASWINRLRPPYRPGEYTAEVWLEDAAGNQGAPAAARLRFDDARPPSIEPLPQPRWIDRNAIPHTVRLSHPAWPLPVSGIRGYAVSVDASRDAGPCAAPDHCLDAETDLRGGIGDDSLSVADLPEGTSYVHAVAVSGSGMRSPTVGTAALHVDRTDPVTRLAGVPAGWTNQPVTLTATATDQLSGMAPDGPGGPFTAIRVDGAVARTASGDSVSAAVIGDGVHDVAYFARDAAGNVNDGGAGNGIANHPPATASVRIDREPPAISFLNLQNPRDPELIEVRVSDALSGPDLSRGRISVRPAGSDGQFEALPTAASGGKLAARWDSDAYPAGRYEFRATGYDAAGNSATTDSRANGSNMVLPSPLKVPTAVHAGFGGSALIWPRCSRRGGHRRCRQQVVESFDRRPLARTIPYGRGTTFSGRLVAGLVSPLAGMPVQVVETFDPGSQPSRRVTTVQTDAEGAFSVELPPGPSRTVTAVFAGTPTLTRSSGQPVRLAILGGVRMRASAPVATVGGRPVVFRGRVGASGAAIPPDGKSVELQFRLPGTPWTEFRTVQTDQRGRFHYAYSFTDDDSRGVRFKFRAVAPAQSDWPFEPAGSRPVAVRGR